MFKECMETLDVPRAQAVWAAKFPHLEPMSEDGTLVMLHHARTQSEIIPFKLRAYSHSWLCERKIPSGLPDRLKPMADRLYPHKVEGVGIAIKSSVPGRAEFVRNAMEVSVLEAFADGIHDPQIISKRMNEAKMKAFRS